MAHAHTTRELHRQHLPLRRLEHAHVDLGFIREHDARGSLEAPGPLPDPLAHQVDIVRLYHAQLREGLAKKGREPDLVRVQRHGGTGNRPRGVVHALPLGVAAPLPLLAGLHRHQALAVGLLAVVPRRGRRFRRGRLAVHVPTHDPRQLVRRLLFQLLLRAVVAHISGGTGGLPDTHGLALLGERHCLRDAITHVIRLLARLDQLDQPTLGAHNLLDPRGEVVLRTVLRALRVPDRRTHTGRRNQQHVHDGPCGVGVRGRQSQQREFRVGDTEQRRAEKLIIDGQALFLAGLGQGVLRVVLVRGRRGQLHHRQTEPVGHEHRRTAAGAEKRHRFHVLGGVHPVRGETLGHRVGTYVATTQATPALAEQVRYLHQSPVPVRRPGARVRLLEHLLQHLLRGA